jgi:hypothetical protein
MIIGRNASLVTPDAFLSRVRRKIREERLVLRSFGMKGCVLRKQIAFAGYVKDFVRGNGGELDLANEYRTNHEDSSVACAVARVPALQDVETSWRGLAKRQLSSHECGDAAAL